MSIASRSSQLMRHVEFQIRNDAEIINIECDLALCQEGIRSQYPKIKFKYSQVSWADEV